MRGYVLAGGRSTRFGSDKALHVVAGVPLAVRTAEVLRAAGLDPWLVVREARDPARLAGLPTLAEPDGPRHPLWGVATALALGEGAFFAPVDLVDLDPARVRALLDARAIATDQPLLGVWPAAMAARAREAALRGDAVRSVAAALPAVDVGAFVNLNRPAP